MRIHRGWLTAALITAALAGCVRNARTHVDGGVLGRVVIYRNGVAFYERHATVEDGKLTVRVPRDRVDDFLKSLTVVDPNTRKPLSVTIPRREADDGSYLTMTLETPDRQHANVLLTYVTEAPAWKPSYRIVVGDDGKVMLEGWAIVDNTTSENWNNVLVGVGASSALAFRYDLWSVRQIDRDLLAEKERFAVAPPTGLSPYAEGAPGTEELAALDSTEVRSDATFSGSTSMTNTYYTEQPASSKPAAATPTHGAIQGQISDKRSGEKLAGVTIVATDPKSKTQETAITDERGFYKITQLPPGAYTLTYFYGDMTVERKGVAVGANKTTPAYQKLDVIAGRGEVIAIKDTAPTIDPTSTTQGITIDKNYIKGIPVPGRTFESALGAAAGSQSDYGQSFSGSSSLDNQYYVDGINTTGLGGATTKVPPPIKQGDEKLKAIAQRVLKDKRDIVVEVHGAAGTEQAANARGTAVKNKLVDDGVPASRIHIVPKLGGGQSDGVRVLAVAPRVAEASRPKPTADAPGSDAPVGESHFMADRAMTVRSGSSAMVAMLHRETTGGVVYLYDPISERGDQRFAFKAVRLDNPTQDTLEPGPVTVYGDGRFIGEGITEPVPPLAPVVVPFALDKQIVVSRNHNESDKIAKLMTVQRGVITAELQHRRQTRFTVTSRLAKPATVYLRHRLETGWALVEQPSKPTTVGDSQLFEVTLAAGETKYVSISEATPVQRTFELGSVDALGMMKVFIEEPDATPELKAQITALLATHHGSADLVDKIQTLREQLVEYRSRSGELHAQLVSLKLVRTSGELMAALRARLAEMSDRIQKTTIELVDTQEKLMLARVKFQNQLADLKLTDATKAVSKR